MLLSWCALPVARIELTSLAEGLQLIACNPRPRLRRGLRRCGKGEVVDDPAQD